MQMHVCFQLAPKRCTNNTPPLRPAAAVLVLSPAVARCTSRIAIPATRFKQSASRSKKERTRFGNTTTHCRTATAGNTCSTRCVVCCSPGTSRVPCTNTLPKSPGRTAHTAPAQSRAPECRTLKNCAGRAPRIPALGLPPQFAPATSLPARRCDSHVSKF